MPSFLGGYTINNCSVGVLVVSGSIAYVSGVDFNRCYVYVGTGSTLSITESEFYASTDSITCSGGKVDITFGVSFVATSGYDYNVLNGGIISGGGVTTTSNTANVLPNTINPEGIIFDS
jgi:hypothetical protein